MTIAFSLAHLTVLDLPPPQMIEESAARTGYRTVGLRLIKATDVTPCYPLMHDKAMMRATKTAMADTGVGVLDIELVKITPDIDVAGLEPFLAAGARLGARFAITAPYDPDLARLADRLGAITDLSVQYGIRAVLPRFFPWTAVDQQVSVAVQVVEAAGRDPAPGSWVDHAALQPFAQHVRATRPYPAVALAVRPTFAMRWYRKNYACTTEELLHAGRAERLPPGEGAIDIKGMLAHMPQGIPVALEVPNDAALTAAQGPEAVALRVRQAATRLLES